MHLKAAGLSTYKMRTWYISLLALKMSSQFSPTNTPLAGIFTVKPRRKYLQKLQRASCAPPTEWRRWLHCCSRWCSCTVVRSWRGDRQQAEEPELRHLRCCVYQAADIPRGAPRREQSSHNGTLVCGSRTCLWEGKKNTQSWSLAGGNICSYDLRGMRTTHHVCLRDTHARPAAQQLSGDQKLPIIFLIWNGLEFQYFHCSFCDPALGVLLLPLPWKMLWMRQYISKKKTISVFRWSLFLGGERA